MLASITACKPVILQRATAIQQNPGTSANIPENLVLSTAQRTLIDAVQMQLFPKDGNGPDAQDLNALAYLEGALQDPANIEDGDPAFIVKGCSWLNDMAQRSFASDFTSLTVIQQDRVLNSIASTRAGENWISLLMYYLTEALMLDPVYGGNIEQKGWRWLEHQPGFPRPTTGKTYLDFT